MVPAYDQYKRPSSVTRDIVDAGNTLKNYVTSYEYNQTSQLTKVTHPSGYSYSPTYDTKGRLSALNGGYVNNITYKPSGQVEGLIVSTSTTNPIIEIYGYNSTQQLVSQTATKGTTQLMNLTYSYQGQADQMGAGTQAGNTGQLVGITGTIEAQTESAAYTYDLLGRLIASDQTTGGQNHQRRFDYDRWGNRTAVYTAVTGGMQAQAVTLEQQAGVPTNRIQSVS